MYWAAVVHSLGAWHDRKLLPESVPQWDLVNLLVLLELLGDEMEVMHGLVDLLQLVLVIGGVAAALTIAQTFPVFQDVEICSDRKLCNGSSTAACIE